MNGTPNTFFGGLAQRLQAGVQELGAYMDLSSYKGLLDSRRRELYDALSSGDVQKIQTLTQVLQQELTGKPPEYIQQIRDSVINMLFARRFNEFFGLARAALHGREDVFSAYGDLLQVCDDLIQLADQEIFDLVTLGEYASVLRMTLENKCGNVPEKYYELCERFSPRFASITKEKLFKFLCGECKNSFSNGLVWAMRENLLTNIRQFIVFFEKTLSFILKHHPQLTHHDYYLLTHIIGEIRHGRTILFEQLKANGAENIHVYTDLFRAFNRVIGRFWEEPNDDVVCLLSAEKGSVPEGLMHATNEGYFLVIKAYAAFLEESLPRLWPHLGEQGRNKIIGMFYILNKEGKTGIYLAVESKNPSLLAAYRKVAQVVWPLLSNAERKELENKLTTLGKYHPLHKASEHKKDDVLYIQDKVNQQVSWWLSETLTIKKQLDKAQGHLVQKEYKEARQIYLRLVESNHVEALYQLGLMDVDKLGGTADETAGIYRLKLAHELGHPFAAYKLGKYFANTKDLEEALAWYQKAKEIGHLLAHSEVDAIERNNLLKSQTFASLGRAPHAGIVLEINVVKEDIPPKMAVRKTLSNDPILMGKLKTEMTVKAEEKAGDDMHE